MSSQQDVHINEVDVLNAYNGKFGDFYEFMYLDLMKILDAMQRIQEQVDKYAKNAREQHEQAKSEAKAARNDWYALMSQPERDPKAVSECRQRLEHVEGHVTHMLQNYVGQSQAYTTQAKRDIAQMNELTIKYRQRLGLMVENGRKFLSMAEEHIRTYKETNLGEQ